MLIVVESLSLAIPITRTMGSPLGVLHRSVLQQVVAPMLMELYMTLAVWEAIIAVTLVLIMVAFKLEQV